MISWIQITFEKHTKAFLAFLLIVITIPFVFTIGASPGIGRGDRQVRQREFFGYNLSNPAVERQIRADTQTSYFFKLGFWVPAENPQLAMVAYDRAASLALADHHRIAPPTKAELDQFLTTLRAFHNEQGQFDAKRYNDFKDQFKTKAPAGVSENDAARVMAEDFRIQKILTLLSGPGVALPGEIAALLTQANTRWTVRVATFDLATYSPAVHPTDLALSAYFETHAGRYEIPAQVGVDYVLFKAADFAPTGPIAEADLTAYFEANKASFKQPSTDPAKPAAEPTLEAVRPAVEAALRQQAGSHAAAKVASDFAYAIFDKKIAKDSPVLIELAAKVHGHRASAPLFSATESPAGLSWPRQVVAEAFRLSESRYYSDALAAGADQLVLLWRETALARKPLLAEVRTKVAADFVAEEQSRMLIENGRQWKAAVEAKLAAGTAFDAAVASLAGAPKSEIKNFGPFTLRHPPEGLGQTVASALGRQAAGSVSELLVESKKAYLVQVTERQAPAIDPASADYTTIRDAIAGTAAAALGSQLVSELVENEHRRLRPAGAD